MRADGLSTALFVMGLEKGLKFANEHGDIQAVFITKDRDIYVTDGLKGSIEITNETYTLKS
jgi:thiamine biosynthesis lipoprotein